MSELRRILQINLFVMVLISSVLLGMAMESSRMIVTAVVGASLGFIVTDMLRLFHLRGVVANIVSVLILVLSMRDFFPGDGTGKLVSVANLLVYLQTVLMFQEKTPRLNWQILVLSLLQVVVSAIFSLDLEGGLLFLGYFLVIGSALFLQSAYSQQWEIEALNRESSRAANRLFGRETGGPRSDALVFFDNRSQTPIRFSGMVAQLVMWATVAFTFTVLMFFLAPRHAKPWYGPLSVQVTTAGVSKSVDLDERGIIDQPGQLMFRARFRKADGGALQINSVPYFRGLALSDLVIRNGQTDWRAPQDRVSDEHYQDLPVTPEVGIPVVQTIMLEETNDPLVYGVFPFFQSETTPDSIMFCHEISGLTRCRLRQTLDIAPFKYEAATLLDANGQFATTWPYISNTGSYVQRPMSEDPPQIAWLTRMDPQRYPTLTQLSDQLARENEAAGGTRIELFRRMERYFRSPGRFRYTLDFRTVQRDEALDPVEDFVRNHRSGHCELYASALTLMLRHQGIPARLVVGFHGGAYNSTTNTFMVRAYNAHAWVEAYLRPEDCTDRMRQNGQAGPGGAWMILESTPIAIGGSLGANRGEAIELARNAWDDYVLGRDAETSESEGAFPMFSWLRGLDVDYIDQRFQQVKRTTEQPWFKYGLPGLIGLIVMVILIRRHWNDDPEDAPTTARIRRFVARAISLISPELGQWVMGRHAGRRVEFYERMQELLQPHRLVRAPTQTHREFANTVAAHFHNHPQSELIGRTVSEFTELFNQVRFGRQPLSEQRQAQVQAELKVLRDALSQAESKPAPASMAS